MAAPNTIKGRDLLLEILDGTYKVIGGVRTKEISRDNPVSDVTNQATGAGGGNETEAAYNGYSTVTINGNGVVDTRSDANIAAYKLLASIANSATPVASLRFSDAEESYTGDFLITTFGKTSEENGIVEFSASFQNQGTITYA